MNTEGDFSIIPDDYEVGSRLDTFLAGHFPEYSRSHLSHLIKDEHVLISGEPGKPGYRVKAEDVISGCLKPSDVPDFEPEPIDLSIIFEDDDVLVINKPPDLVVHPGPGHSSGTLVNALLHYLPQIEGVGGEERPGIVHRLDKDTSGLILVAKTPFSLEELSRQFQMRTVRKTYLALVHGVPELDKGDIQLPIGRHPIDRKKMSVVSRNARSAITHWRVAQRLDGVCLMEVTIKTGRTHQIRVHLSSIGHSVLGDDIYGSRTARSMADRQLLHAWRIRFEHPVSHAPLFFEAPMPADFTAAIQRYGAANQAKKDL